MKALESLAPCPHRASYVRTDADEGQRPGLNRKLHLATSLQDTQDTATIPYIYIIYIYTVHLYI